MTMKTVGWVFLLVLLVGCGGDKEQAAMEKADGPLAVRAVNYPLAYFATRIGGGQVKAAYPGPADEDPAFWQPEIAEIGQFQAADLILLNGAGYAKWVPMASLPASKTVDTSRGFTDRFIVEEEAATHTHGPGGDHAHAGTAFTTWLDFSQAEKQAAAIRDALKAARPEHAATFEANFTKLASDLRSLDEKIATIVKGKNDRPLVASHPVYQYLARAQDLNLKSVLWEPQTVPGRSAMMNLKDILKGHSAAWMIWEAEPVAESVIMLEEMGVESMVFDPCASQPDEGDFLSVMRRNVQELAKAFE
jgi:zinc transport system substrate-binding protein